MSSNLISSLNNIGQFNHSAMPHLYGIKAVSDKASINSEGVQVIYTRIPAVLILFGFMIEALNVTLTRSKANYTDDCSHFEHTAAMLSESVSKGIAKVEIELTIPGTYYVCIQSTPNNNETSLHKQWIHQGSNYHVELKVQDRLMPIPLQISLIILCLALSGTFSGLNLGLMSLDLNEIQVIIRCGTDSEKQYAKIIAPIRKKGNYLLCSILFGNVLVNSTLTILMDDLTSGLIAVIVSTLSIVIFGEIVPQAICSRHGLAVGAKTIYLTKLFMLLTFPLSLFISKILDRVLGEEIGHVYDRERLMEYIKITKTYNQLEDDEMNIISGALGLKTKTAEDVMTRLEDAFMLPITSILDFNTVSEISKKGYSRIPVYDSERKNIVGLLHSKDLTFIDPDDKKPLKTIIEFYKHPLIHTDADERLNNVLNHFKYGKSHLAFVRKLFDTGDEDPYFEIVGLITLEDVIEEILQIEIVDETDILTDNRRKQKRKGIQFRQDFSDFAKIGEGEVGSQVISPQMGLAIFQYLSTAIEPFQRKFISENILRRLIGQKIYYFIEMDELEERTYLTSNSFLSSADEDDSKLLYKYGKPADYFIMILEGKVKVIVGNEKLTYDAGPFTFFGVSALKPSAFITRMLMNCSSFACNSNPALNNLNSSLNQQTISTLNTFSTRPISPESIPLLDNHPLQSNTNSRPQSPEISSIVRSPSCCSELLNMQHQQPLESHAFTPDFTVKAVENTLYMKIPRKVYLAAFRASIMDRKDDFLQCDLDMFKEEVDGLIYNRLANKSFCNNQSTLNSNKMRKSSSDLIKDKKLSVASMPTHLQQQLQQQYQYHQAQQQQTTAPVTSVPNCISYQIGFKTPVIDSKQAERYKAQSSRPIRKFIKHQSMPSSANLPSNLSSTNLANLNANNNSYTTINNNITTSSITNIITNPQQNFELGSIVVDGSSKEIKTRSKF